MLNVAREGGVAGMARLVFIQLLKFVQRTVSRYRSNGVMVLDNIVADAADQKSSIREVILFAGKGKILWAAQSIKNRFFAAFRYIFDP